MPRISTYLAATCGAVVLVAGCSAAEDPASGTDPAVGTPGQDDATAGSAADAGAAVTSEPAGDPGADPGETGTEPDTAAATDPGATAEAAAPGISPADIDLSTLTDSWPCGYAFELSAPDGSASLVLEWTVPEAALPRVVTLPNPRWEGRLLLGEGLAAVSCTPRTEPAGVHETWEVPAGTIRFQDGGGVPQGPVRANLTGVLAKAPDGTWLELPNQEVVNQGWGVTYDDMG